MSDRYYSIDLTVEGSMIPVPAQTGIRDERIANAMKLLYPKHLRPTVGEDTVSISALGRAYAQAAKSANDGNPSEPPAEAANPSQTHPAGGQAAAASTESAPPPSPAASSSAPAPAARSTSTGWVA